MIELKAFRKKDIPILLNWVPDDKFLLQWAGPIFRYPLTKSQLSKHLAKTKGDKPSLVALKAIESESQTPIGYIELANIDYANCSATLSRVLIGPVEKRNKGLGKEMVKAAVDIGFKALNLHRISLAVFDFNKSAINCYKSIGFKLEGTMRECRRYKDEYWNLHLMGMLENEWRHDHLHVVQKLQTRKC